MNDNKWLEALKPDDIVIENRTMYSIRYWAMSKVLRLTKTQIIVGNASRERRYRRSDGCEVSSDIWHRTHLLEATEENMKIFREDRIRYEAQQLIRATSFNKLSTASLVTIKECIERDPKAN
jgi:hypothetical protein